jgi:hypothetical protein
VNLPSYSKVDDTRKFIKNIAASEDTQPRRISITRAGGDFLRTSPRAAMMTRVGEGRSLAPTHCCSCRLFKAETPEYKLNFCEDDRLPFVDGVIIGERQRKNKIEKQEKL